MNRGILAMIMGPRHESYQVQSCRTCSKEYLVLESTVGNSRIRPDWWSYLYCSTVCCFADQVYFGENEGEKALGSRETKDAIRDIA